MPEQARYEISFRRAVLALLGGAVTGALITATLIAVSPDGLGEPGDLFFNILGLIAFWLIALTIFGMPLWLVLHNIGLRQWYVAIASGAIIPAFILMAILGPQITSIVPFSISSAAAAWVFWRIAYRKANIAEAP